LSDTKATGWKNNAKKLKRLMSVEEVHAYRKGKTRPTYNENLKLKVVSIK